MGRDYIGRGTLAGLDIERVALDDASGQATLLARLSQSNNVKICRDAAFAKPPRHYREVTLLIKAIFRHILERVDHQHVDNGVEVAA